MNYVLDILNEWVKLVPVKLRGPRLIVWVQSLLRPLQTVANQFAGKVAEVQYRLTFTGQVIYLEHRLNDEFDPSARSIYIDDPTQAGIIPVFIYNIAEQQPATYLYNVAEAQPSTFIYDVPEYSSNTDFIVFIPASLNTDLTKARMKKVINSYKQAGRRYQFQTI